MKGKTIFAILIILLVGSAVFWRQAQNDAQETVSEENPTSNKAIASVSLPAELTAKAQAGKDIFDARCALCHGRNAAGQESVAPPLIHEIYEPSHHGDESFQRAAALGVRSHHWPFGNMPPVKGLTRAEVSDIIAYVRELQRANGIF